MLILTAFGSEELPMDQVVNRDASRPSPTDWKFLTTEIDGMSASDDNLANAVVQCRPLLSIQRKLW